MQRPQADSPEDYRYRLRRARFKLFEELVDEVLAKKSSVSILDMGGRAKYWNLLDSKYYNKVSITVVNLEERNKIHEKESGLNDKCNIIMRIGDGTNLFDVQDKEFDIAHSNSVIEHVGMYSAMERFASETRRVGNAYFVQTPNFWFPFEPHFGLPFFQWLPEPTRIAINTRFGAGFYPRGNMENAIQRTDYIRLVSKPLMRHFFPDAVHKTEKFYLMPKSLMAIRQPVF